MDYENCKRYILPRVNENRVANLELDLMLNALIMNKQFTTTAKLPNEFCVRQTAFDKQVIFVERANFIVDVWSD